jgi:hypothetical protein
LLEDLRALVEFAHAGSIAVQPIVYSGRLCDYPASARLEAALGAELLDRSVKPPRLNSLGFSVLGSICAPQQFALSRILRNLGRPTDFPCDGRQNKR